MLDILSAHLQFLLQRCLESQTPERRQSCPEQPKCPIPSSSRRLHETKSTNPVPRLMSSFFPLIPRIHTDTAAPGRGGYVVLGGCPAQPAAISVLLPHSCGILFFQFCRVAQWMTGTGVSTMSQKERMWEIVLILYSWLQNRLNTNANLLGNIIHH
jgi:hypothetical protein